MRIMSLGSSLKVGRDCIARFEKVLFNKNTRAQDDPAELQRAHNAPKCLLKIKIEGLCLARVELTAVHSKLKELRIKPKEIDMKLSIAQMDVSLQTTWRDESCEQLSARVAELKEVRSRLEVRKVELLQYMIHRLYQQLVWSSCKPKQ